MSSNDLEGDDIWGDGGNEEAKEEAKEEAPQEEEVEVEDDETRHMTVGELRQRMHLIQNDIRVMKSDVQRITHDSRSQRERIRENQEKVKLNKQLPYLVANVVEILEADAEDGMFWFGFQSLLYILLLELTSTPLFVVTKAWKKKKKKLDLLQM